jgi:hypothetical protein
MGEACSLYGRKERCIQPEGKGPFGKTSLIREDIKMALLRYGVRGQTGLIWRRIGIRGGLLKMP